MWLEKEKKEGIKGKLRLCLVPWKQLKKKWLKKMIFSYFVILWKIQKNVKYN